MTAFRKAALVLLIAWVVYGGFVLGLWWRSRPTTTQADVEYIGGDSDHLYCHRKTPTEFECVPLKQFLEALTQTQGDDSNYPL